MHTTTPTSDTTTPGFGPAGGSSGIAATAMTDAASTVRPAVDGLEQAVATIVAGLDRPSTVDGELSELTLTLRAIDRLQARAVMLAGEVDGHRAAVEEGMHVDLALQLHTDTTRSDIAMVLTAAEVLASMPATALLFGRGVLSWGHIRVLVAGVRRLDVRTRAELDRELDAQADRLAAMEPEARLWALDEAVEQRLSERHLEQREQQAVEREFLALQPRFDGSGTAYGEFGPVSFAALTAGLDAKADAPQAAPCPGDQDGPGESVPTRGQQYAAALLRLCTRGTNLLAAQRYAPDITAPVRRAVQTRDGGCRFPGCTAPVAWCDVHHVHERSRGGDHRPDNLTLLCRRHHTSVHRSGWHQTLLPDGTYTIRRRGRTWTTLPRRDQRWNPPDPPPDGEPPTDRARPGDATPPPDGTALPPGGAALPPSATDPPRSDRDPSHWSPGSGPPPLDVTDPLPF